MPCRLACVAAIIVGAVFMPTARVHAADPVLSLVLPRGAQRGTEVELTLYGRRLEDALEVRFESPAIQFLSLEETRTDRLRARIRIAPDAVVGSYLLQVRTASGATGYQSFHIGALAHIEEVEPNDQMAQAQSLALDTTILGTLQARDLDLYRISLAEPTRIACELEGVRLGDRVFDARLEWVDAQGRLLAAADDDPRGRMDPVLVHHFEQPGDYVLRVRELTWSSAGSARYLLHVGRFPRPAICLPLGAPAGTKLELRWLGNGPSFTQSVDVPSDSSGYFYVCAVNEWGAAPTPQRLAISAHRNCFEDEAQTPLESHLAVALNGVLEERGEVDTWKLDCKANQTLSLEVLAREYGSPLDAVLEVFDENDTWLAGNDDGRSPDSRLTYRCPRAGVYAVRIRDLLGRGGPSFAYRIQLGAVESKPQLELGISRGRPRPTALVPRNGRGAVVLDWRDKPIPAEAEILAQHLPAGVRAQIPLLSKGLDWLPVVFEADVDAPLTMSALEFAWRNPGAAEPGAHESAIAFQHYVPLLRVENDQPYIVKATKTLGFSVQEELPFDVQLTPPTTPIVAGATLALDVHLTRKQGFDEAVRIELLRTPSGLIAQAVQFEKGATQKALQIEARGDAAAMIWPLVISATTTIGGVPQSCASPLYALEVVRPVANVGIGRARTEVGQATNLELILRPTQALPSGTQLELIDLPKGMRVAAPIAFQPEGDQKLQVALELDPDSPVGRHRNFKVRLAVPHAGGFLEHRFSGGEIRVDAPLPARLPTDPTTTKPAPERGSVANPKT